MNKTIFITGASKGIGRKIAELFIEKGWNVVATMRSPEKETEFTQLPNVLVTELDVLKPETIQKSIQLATEKFGKIEVLVNNAAYGQFGLFEAVKPEQIEQQFQVNVFGLMNVTRAMLPHFRANKGGMILNISSGAGRVGMPMVSIYATSKFAVEGFSESLYYELHSQDIKVKLVEPGGVDTGFHALAAQNFAFDASLTDYNDYVERFTKKFEAMHHGMATTQQVAQTVYTAITDEEDRLRYIIGNDVSGWVEARLTKNEEGYIAHMKDIYEAK